MLMLLFFDLFFSKNRDSKETVKNRDFHSCTENAAAMMKSAILVVNKGCCLLWDFKMAAKLDDKSPYLANSANCLGSLKSIPGRPPGGIFFPVMYSVKSGD